MADQQYGNAWDLTASKLDRDTADLRRDIAAQKEAISGTIHQLDQRVKRSTDWRAQVSEHPFLAVGAAFAVGGLLSVIFKRKTTPQERVMDALADGFEDITHRVRNRMVSQLTSGVSLSVLKTIGAVLATKVAASYMTNGMNDEPGFADQERNL